MGQFEIKVAELDAGGKQYDFLLDRAWLDRALDLSLRGEHDLPLRADPAAPEGVVSVYAEKSGDDVIVRGRIRTRLLTECSRCLADAPIPVDTDLVALYTARGAGHRPVPDEAELSPEELDKEFYSGDTVVLDALVRENVLLEVPMQPLCAESCEGLEVPESVRGPADLAGGPVHEGKKIDPRFAPLLSLVDKTKDAEAGPAAADTKKKAPKKKGRS